MRLNVAERTIERVGIQHERSFSIKATGKAFRILSSGLYKNKICAIIRELSCNAYDAHVAAGKKDVPFHVHLPNTLEPFFSVRDEGVGLSDEDMNIIYTTYFESTKTESNEVIGALGLGSKAPFSYVDSFTVISRHNGMARTYSAFISEDGMPSLVRMQEEPTTEHNGLEVIIPVEKTDDFLTFRSTAETTLAYFNPQPNVVGTAKFKCKTAEVILTANDWRAVERSGYDTGVYAIMGSIAYPIHAPSLGQKLGNKEHNLLRYASIDIDFPIGSLDITAGREELSYDPVMTNPAIISKLEKITEEMPTIINKMFDNCKTEYEARKLYEDIFGYNRPLGKALGSKFSVTWNGKTISSSSIVVSAKDLEGIGVVTYSYNYSRGGVSSSGREAGSDYDFNIHSAEHLFRDDLLRGQTGRIREYLKKNHQHRVILISGSDENVERLMKLLDGYPMKQVSSLDKPPSVPKNKVYVKTLTKEALKKPSVSVQNLQDTDVEIDDGGIYVITHSQKIVGVENRAEFQQKFEMAIKHKIFDQDKDELFFVPKTLSDAFVKHDDWKTFYDVMKERAEQKISSEVKPELIANAKTWKIITTKRYEPRFVFEVISKIKMYLPADHYISEMHSKWTTYKKAHDEFESLSLLADQFGIKFEKSVSDYAMETDWDVFAKKYPMLLLVTKHAQDRWVMFDEKTTREVCAYIEMVDKSERR